MNRPVLEGLRLNAPAYVHHTRLLEWVAEGLWGLVTWLAGLIVMVLMRGVRIFGRAARA